MFTITTEPNRIVLTHENHAQAEIFPFGALLNRFAILQSSQQWHNVIAAYASPEAAQRDITQLFRSAKLSPFACRLAQGNYSFSGCDYHVNKHKLGDSAIHGLIYDAPFTLHHSHVDEHSAAVELRYSYRHEHAGYPFDYDISVRYELRENAALSVCTEVRNTGETALPIVDGWHPYFAVDGDLDDWQLHINSQAQLAFSAALLPTGETTPDERFLHGSTLANISLDNCFIRRDNTAPAVTLQGKRIRLTLSPDESYPYVQAYIPDDRKSIALENLSAAPDAFNNKIGLIELQAGEAKAFETVYQLSEI
ncbi:aldose 1-epimerase [Kingella negevensis]|uniref:aldose 1-epimerase n=1 Tax=Kingella negevensis TaxID=1522312 RepID=UPI00050A1D5C|nr:aldose 1-epimerase [Kingella negevensis]MDK4688097.1 aldose 1-epimerase [Kingella negevensis]WII90920.1 aldose 1-epimerase [Kingella negevensis]